MGIVALPSFGSDPATITAAGLDGKVDPLATEFNGNVDNDNIKASAGIVYSKLNLTGSIVNADVGGSAAIASSKLDLSAIAQNLVMSSKIVKLAKGADVASVAGAITLGDDGNYFDITGTNAITSITAKTAGTQVVLQFDSTASLVDGSNLKLQGNFQGAAEAQITLVSDGTNWFEVSRNNITTVSAADQSGMETGSSTTTYVSPGRQHYHPSAAKAWCKFNGATAGTNAPTAGYNVTSVTRNSAGNYTINFTTAFSSANYCLVPCGARNEGGGDSSVTQIYSQSTSSAVILTVDGGFSPADFDIVCVVCFGDL